MKKFYITTPIYYVNDVPHVGHAYTTIASDILARYYRQKLGPENVWFLTGTDEHGVKISQSAEKNNQSPQEFCDEVSAKFQIAWDHLNISNNDFIRTTETRHEETVRFVLEKLKEIKGPNGEPVLFKKNYEGLYCTGCESYKTENELVDGKCSEHPKNEITFLKEENWFFRLSDFGNLLKEKIERNDLQILPESRKNEVLSFVNEGLKDIAISRANVDWGIPVPYDKEQTVYVWVDALINYISALGFKDDDEKFKNFWPADVHLMAKDILKFHAIIWPAILMALNLELPKKVFAHGYFTIDGQKMGKSIGNVIDPLDLVKEFESDGARHLIISQFPFGGDGDIKAEEFKIKYNSDLANGLGNLVSRVLGMTEKYFEGNVPNGKYIAEFDLKDFWSQLDKGFEKLEVYDNLQLIMKLVNWCDGYVDEQKPWEIAKVDQEKLANVLYSLLELIRHLSLAILPYLPETATKIWEKLGLIDVDKEKFENLIEVGLTLHNTKIKKGEPLFLRKE